MAAHVHSGFCEGEERRGVPLSKTRGLLPQIVLLNILKRVVMARSALTLCGESSRRGFDVLLLGGARGSEPQDIIFAIAQVLETARDRYDAGAVAQADIEKFHDNVSWGYVLKDLLSRGVSAVWARAA